MSGLATLIPATTTKYILGSLYDSSVILPLANPQILAQSRIGSTVTVNVIPKLTAGAYSGTKVVAAATSAAYTYNFATKVYNSILIPDDEVGRSVSDMQSMVNKFIEAEIQAFTDAADSALAGMYSHLYQLGSGASPIDCTDATKAMTQLRAVASKMDIANIPANKRWGVVGPTMAAWLKAGAAATITDNRDIVTTGYIGSLYGIKLYQSNNIVADTSADEVCLFGYDETFAFSHMEPVVETARSQVAFGTQVDALYVFGGLDLGHPTSDVRGIALYANT